MSLFRHKKRLSPHRKHPELYFNACYFTKQLSEGVGIVAESDRTSKKRAAELLMRAGASSYIGDKCKLSIENSENSLDYHRRLEYKRFVALLKK